MSPNQQRNNYKHILKLSTHIEELDRRLNGWRDKSMPAYRRTIEEKQRYEMERKRLLQKDKEHGQWKSPLHATSANGRESAGRVQESRGPRGFEGLKSKQQDMTRYFEKANLTDKQREVASMRFEYDLTETAIAKRLGLHRTTVQEHLAAVNKRLSRSGDRQRKLSQGARRTPDF